MNTAKNSVVVSKLYDISENFGQPKTSVVFKLYDISDVFGQPKTSFGQTKTKFWIFWPTEAELRSSALNPELN